MRRALAAVGRIGVLTLGASLWWIAGLWAQGRYGIPILRYTETYETVREGLDAPELLRGPRLLVLLRRRQARPLDRAERRLHAAPVAHRRRVPARRSAGLLAAGARALAHRGYFVALLVVGTIIAVGAHPCDDPSPLGSIFKAFAASRPRARVAVSTPRAVPLIVLSARRVARRRDACARRSAPDRAAAWPRSPRSPSLVINLPPLFTGQMLGRQPAAARGHPVVLAARRRTTSQSAGRRDAACSSCRARTSRRTDGATPSTRSLPGPDGPAVRRPRADPVRHAAVGRPAQRPRPPPPGGLVRAVVARHGRRTHGGRRHHRPLRPAVRALPHAPPAQPLGRRRGDARASALRPSSATPVPNRRDPRAAADRRGRSSALPRRGRTRRRSPRSPSSAACDIVRAENADRRDAHGGQTARASSTRRLRGSSPRTNPCSIRRRSRATPTACSACSTTTPTWC